MSLPDISLLRFQKVKSKKAAGMTTTVVTTKITQEYLMKKSKRDLAHEYQLLSDMNDRLRSENENLKASLHNRDAILEVYRIEMEQMGQASQQQKVVNHG